jgi:hypothetical protein
MCVDLYIDNVIRVKSSTKLDSCLHQSVFQNFAPHHFYIYIKQQQYTTKDIPCY